METLTHCILCGENRLDIVDPANRMVRCASCGLFFDNPRPSLTEITEFYSGAGHYDHWLGEKRGRDRLWKRRLKLVLSFRRSGELLDIGAGIGQFLHLAKRHFSVTGTEVSREAIQIAKSEFGVELLDGYPDSLEREGRTYDVVTVFHVLEHVPHPGETLALCYRLLRPGGFIVIAVPNELGLTRAAIKRSANRMLRSLGLPGFAVAPLYERISLDPESSREVHLSHFSPTVLRGALPRAGFRVVRCSLDPYFTSLGIKLLYRQLDYHALRFWSSAIGLNLYETILVVGQKR